MAQVNRATLLAAIAADLADNVSGDISAADLRTILTNMADSMYNLIDVDPIDGLNPFLTATPAAASTVDFTSGITSASGLYELKWWGVTTSVDGAALWLRTSTNAGVSFDSAAQNYERARKSIDANGTTFNAASNDATEIILSRNVGNGALESTNGSCRIWFPSSSTLATHIDGQSVFTNNLDEPEVMIYGAIRDAAADVDALRVLPSSGTITGNMSLTRIRTTT